MKQQLLLSIAIILFLFLAPAIAATKHYQEGLIFLNLVTTSKKSAIQFLEQHTKKDANPIFFEYAKRVLLTATPLLENTPGFLCVLQNVVCHLDNPETAKGPLFELELAMQIAQNNDESIIKLNERLNCKYTPMQREFDIVTNSRLIECKNRKKLKNYLKEQFLAQKIIAQHNFPQKQYMVVSKTPLSITWQKWFTDHQIHFNEFTQETNEIPLD